MDTTRLLAFSGSFFLIAMSPGLCMTLAMSLGIRIGVRRTLWMMLGEVVGIALVGACAMLGVAAVLLGSPMLFTIFKLAGAAYLVWTAVHAWRAAVSTVDGPATRGELSALNLITQGFVTAVANPKAWAFMIALLPPFLVLEQPLAPQMASLLGLMVIIEFTALMIYAQGGRSLSDWLVRRGRGHWLNRISAALMFGVAGWLVFG